MAAPPFDLDQANPLDTALVSTYPANERTFRENVEDWMNFEHGSASGRHKIPTGNDAARDAITDWEAGSLWLSSQGTLTTLQMNNGSKASPDWEDVTGITTVGDLTIGVAAGMAARLAVGTAGLALRSDGTNPAWAGYAPSGTISPFQQTAAPLGWTKETTHNNKALRVVTGTASSGGATTFSSVFNAAGGATALSTAQLAAHSHNTVHDLNDTGAITDLTGTRTIMKGRTDAGGDINDYELSGFAGGSATLGPSETVGSGSTHTHVTPDIQFVDLILAACD